MQRIMVGALGAIVGGIIGSTITHYNETKKQPMMEKRDLTDDGIQDYEIYNPKTKEHYAFIGQKEGSFEKADVIMQDGYHFYQTPDGHYGPWGNYFENLPLKKEKEE